MSFVWGWKGWGDKWPWSRGCVVSFITIAIFLYHCFLTSCYECTKSYSGRSSTCKGRSPIGSHYVSWTESNASALSFRYPADATVCWRSYLIVFMRKQYHEQGRFKAVATFAAPLGRAIVQTVTSRPRTAEPRFHSRPVRVRFVVHKVTLWRGFPTYNRTRL